MGNATSLPTRNLIRARLPYIFPLGTPGRTRQINRSAADRIFITILKKVIFKHQVAFYALFDPKLSEAAFNEAVSVWQINHFDEEVLNKIKRYREAVEKLPARHKRPFIMTRYEDCIRKEVAARLGIPPSTTNKYIKAALRSIRDHLGDPNAELLPAKLKK